MAHEELSETARRAVAWHHARHDAVCDVIEPWEHGTVVRATGYPTYWDYNAVRVEDDPEMTAEDLMAFADEALEGLAHRRLDFDIAAVGDALRPAFEAAGWQATRLLFMHHEGPPPSAGASVVEEVGYDDVHALRVAWHREDFPDLDTRHFAHAREVALGRGARLLAALEDGVPAGFAQLEHVGDGAEVTQVYVDPDRRGGGLGTALTAAAIGAAGAVEDLWIAADDEDRPKLLYEKLGFRPAWTSMELTRLPIPRDAA
jgi:ribosomal protein S18 acetylase RimI-like enzyme